MTSEGDVVYRLQVIQMLLEKCQAQELSLEEVDLLTDKCSKVEVELAQLHTDLDSSR